MPKRGDREFLMDMLIACERIIGLGNVNTLHN